MFGVVGRGVGVCWDVGRVCRHGVASIRLLGGDCFFGVAGVRAERARAFLGVVDGQE